MKRRILYIIVIISLMLNLSGCGGLRTNRREISSLLIIQTMGFDSCEEGVRLSISSGRLDDKESTILSKTAPTITIAMDLLQDYSSKENLFYAHTSHILIGGETAEKGTLGMLDYIARSIQLRTTTPIYIVKEDSAQTAISGVGDGSYDITDELKTLERDVELRSESHVFTCDEIIQSLEENGAALVCAISCADTEGVISSGGGGYSVVPEGFAVIKGDRVIGYLSPDLARGTNLLMNHIQAGYNEIEDQYGNRITLSVIQGSTEFETIYEPDGSISKIIVDSSLDMSVAELSDPTQTTVDEFNAAVEQNERELVQAWIEEVLDFSQREGVDFLGLGSIVENKNPVKFSKIPGGWEAALPEIEFDVRVSVEIIRSSDTVEPLLVYSSPEEKAQEGNEK